MANAAVIRKVMSTITDDTLNTSVFAMQDDDKWVGDLAGHTVRYAGLLLNYRSDVLWDDQDNPRPVSLATETVTHGPIHSAAGSILDLTDDQVRDVFFRDAETVDQLWEIVTKYTGVTR